MKFTKMHGCGNDYVYIDCFQEKFPEGQAAREEMIRRLSDRHTGVGGDGVIFICPSDVADAQMRMFNADGSESAMCGNGVRCVAKYVYDHGLARKDTLVINTPAGRKAITVVQEQGGRAMRLRVDMGAPVLEPSGVPTTLAATQVVSQTGENAVVLAKLAVTDDFTPEVTCVSMGNPHCVVFVEEITDRQIFQYGPQMEILGVFPQRTNVEFIRVLSQGELDMRVWERGSGETRACGTGASAACVAGVLAGKSARNVRVHLLGGDLELEWSEADNHVFMTGPAVEVFHGEVEIQAV